MFFVLYCLSKQTIQLPCTLTCFRALRGDMPTPGLAKSSYILLTGGAPLLSLGVGTTG